MPDASGARRVLTSAPPGSSAPLGVGVLDEGQPPVVPAVTGVLAQPLHELREALAVGVEVVLERLLQHPVHGLQVGGVGHRRAVAEVVGPHPAYDDAGPHVRGGLVGGHRSRHVQPGPRAAGGRRPRPSRAAGASPVSRSSSSRVRDRSRSAAMCAATSEVQPKSAAASASARGKAGSTTTRRSLRPAARSWTLAQATSEPSRRLDDDLAAGPRADADHLALHEVGVDGPVLGRQRAPEVDEGDQGRDVAGERRPRGQARAGARDAGRPAARRGDGPPGHRSTHPERPRGRPGHHHRRASSPDPSSTRGSTGPDH